MKKRNRRRRWATTASTAQNSTTSRRYANEQYIPIVDQTEIADELFPELRASFFGISKGVYDRYLDDAAPIRFAPDAKGGDVFSRLGYLCMFLWPFLLSDGVMQAFGTHPITLQLDYPCGMRLSVIGSWNRRLVVLLPEEADLVQNSEDVEWVRQVG